MLGEANREKLALAFALEETRAPAGAARAGAAARGMKSALVCAAQAPFVTGGAEILVRDLAAKLAGRGFKVDVVSRALPRLSAVRGRPPGARLAAARAARDGRPRARPRDPDEVPELPGAPPAQGGLALPPVPRGLRPLRDRTLAARSSPAKIATLRRGRAGDGRRRRLASAGASSRSRERSDRLARWNAPRRRARCYPPPPLLGRYRSEGYGDYLLWAGRLEQAKRPELAIRALAASRRAARLKIAGRARSSPSCAGWPRRRRRGPGRIPRLRLRRGPVSLYAGCRAVSTCRTTRTTAT